MGEKDRLSRLPLFDPPPGKLKDQEGTILSSYHGSIGHYGVIMILDPRYGTPIRATFVDLFHIEENLAFEPLKRAKWASHKRDITEGTREYFKLEVIEEEVRNRWKEWRAANPNHPYMREYKAPFLVQTFIPITPEPRTVFERPEPQKGKVKKKKNKPEKDAPPMYLTPSPYYRNDEVRLIGQPETVDPVLSEKVDREFAEEYRKFLARERNRRKNKGKSKKGK